MENVCFILEQEGLIRVKIPHLLEDHFGKFLRILFQLSRLFWGITDVGEDEENNIEKKIQKFKRF